MKIAIVILAVAIAGAFAQEATTPVVPPFTCTDNAFVCLFKELGHKIKHHAKSIGGKLADVGTALTKSILDQGTSLLSNGAQAVAGTLLEHISKNGGIGKRDTLFEKIKGHLQNGMDKLKETKENLHAAFKKAVAKIMGVMKNNASLKNIEEDTDKKIDAAVDEFDKDSKKGFFSMAKTIAGKVKAIFTEGLAKIKAKFGKKMEAREVVGFSSFASKVKDIFSGLTQTVKDTFAPHVDAIKGVVKGLGDQAKTHVGNLVNAAKASANDLAAKLSKHLDTLKGHAQTLGDHANNAVDALKEAVSSIAKQALENAKGTIGDAVKTGSDAAKVVVDHVGKAIPTPAA